MPKLFFKYGTMNSSKTANLLMTAYTYNSQGKNTVLMKPYIDKRFGDNMIKSRAMPGRVADIIIEPSMSDFTTLRQVDCVLVDEAQFLSICNVDGLRQLALHTTVICYGLRTDYKMQLFEGSKRLLEVSDTIEEIKTSCQLCNRKATVNAKFTVTPDGQKHIVTDGSNEPDLGGEDKYQQMCYDCYSKVDTVNKNTDVLIQFDGGSRGNPGLSGAGAVIYSIVKGLDDTLVIGDELHSVKKLLRGSATNNQAEYTGFIIGMELAKKHGYRNVEVQGDSKLIVNQINGVFECKSKNLVDLCDRARFLKSEFENINISHIYRDKNKRADELANEAMDSAS
jgi:thymidine kinase